MPSDIPGVIAIVCSWANAQERPEKSRLTPLNTKTVLDTLESLERNEEWKRKEV